MKVENRFLKFALYLTVACIPCALCFLVPAEEMPLRKAVANFILYAELILYLYFKYGRQALSAYSLSIREQLSHAAATLAAAEDESHSVRQRLTGIEREQEELIAQLESEGQKTAESIIEQAHAAALRHDKDIDRQIENEQTFARDSIRAAAAARALKEARERLRMMLTADEDRRIRREVIESLQG